MIGFVSVTVLLLSISVQLSLGIGRCPVLVAKTIGEIDRVGRENISVKYLGTHDTEFPATRSRAPASHYELTINSGGVKHRLKLEVANRPPGSMFAYGAMKPEDLAQRVIDAVSQLPVSRVRAIRLIRVDGFTPLLSDKGVTVGHCTPDIFQSDIDLFPATAPERIERTLFHELGHATAHRVFASTKPPKAWIRAAERDGNAVSDYAKTAWEEDFAETVAVYLQTKGGRSDPQVRALYPNRFALLDETFSAPGLRRAFREYVSQNKVLSLTFALAGARLVIDIIVDLVAGALAEPDPSPTPEKK